MRQVLASIGIGNATVDTVLPSTSVRPGESVDAEVRVEGGEAAQDVSYIDLELETQYATDDGYRTATIDRLHLTDGFTVDAGESLAFDTALEIPWATPVTLGRVDVWVETELEIDLAVDPEDRDYLDVEPTPRMEAVFDAVDDLGFSFRTADCQGDPYGRYVTGRRFVQEFEFRPRGGRFAGDVDEIELVFDPQPGALRVFVEVDRRGGLLAEAMDADESHERFELAEPDRDAARDRIESLLAKHV
jgi:sporulation-control protein